MKGRPKVSYFEGDPGTKPEPSRPAEADDLRAQLAVEEVTG